MITAPQMLRSIRRELGTTVLPHLSDERVRSSVIAMIGILGDLSTQVREDDDWAERSVELLREATERWGLPVPKDDTRSPARHRIALLSEIDRFVARLWREGNAGPVIRDVRAVLRADVELQRTRESPKPGSGGRNG